MFTSSVAKFPKFPKWITNRCHLLRPLSTTTLFAPDPTDHALPPSQQQRLVDFMQHCSTHRLDVAILSGAGLSTASGIPDYRSTKGSYTKGHKPMQHQDFVKSTSKRKRFWARSLRGYKYFGSRSPNLAHVGLAALEKAKAISGIVTQNVDRLHHLAGSSNVVELHGRGDRVVCLSCAHVKPRALFTKEMEDLNVQWMKKHGIRILRFTCTEVERETQRILKMIDEALMENPSPPDPLSP